MSTNISPGTAQPSSLETIEKFIATKHALDTPIVFANKTDKFESYLCCGPAGWMGTLCIGALFMIPCTPVPLFCPSKISEQYLLLVSTGRCMD